MRKVIQSVIASVDGVFAETDFSRFFAYHDEAYLRDSVSAMLGADAVLMGRNTYENCVKIWPGSSHPWAERLNSIPKRVFSSTLESAAWNNATVVRGDVVKEVSKLKDVSIG